MGCATQPGPELGLAETSSAGSSALSESGSQSSTATPTGQTPKSLPGPKLPPVGTSNLCANVRDGGSCGPRGRCWDEVCVPMRCGDGTRDPHEQCDDGNRRSDDGCSMHCQAEYCGDGVLQPQSEACEPQAAAPGACNEACIAVATCGNGQPDPAEQCDDGNTEAGDGCSALCTLEARCGDGKLEVPEECDDGNLVNGDGCSATCIKDRCGDGIIQGQEQCDDGKNNGKAGCRNNCTLAQRDCGNGQVDPGEGCDDGNFANDDACPNDCQLPVCGDGRREGFEGCDDGNLAPDDGCDPTCQPEYTCGDKIVERGEQCDDGNQNNQDACPNDCQFARCGDGVVEGRELCDPGGEPSSTCDAGCRWVETCGDGRLTPSEACDDGNTIDGDGCSSSCALEGCGNGILEVGEGCDDGNAVQDDGCTACQPDWVNADCSACVVEHCPLPGGDQPDNRSRCLGVDHACKRILACYFEQGCVRSPADHAALPPNSALGAMNCFCGDTPLNACVDERIAPDPQGACREELFEAYSSRVPAVVIRDFFKRETGAGRAATFATCMARSCHAQCFVNAPRPSCDPAACDDKNPCTRSFCNEQERCVHEPVEPGVACARGVCAQGECVQCIQDSDCGEESTCTLAPTCQDNRCVPGDPRVCEQDDNPCTEASCDPAQGCVVLSANEGQACGENQLCVQGSCNATGNQASQTLVIPVALQGSEYHQTLGLPSWYSKTYKVERSYYHPTEKITRAAFHCFSLDAVAGVVVKATLRVVHPSTSYNSQHDQELVTYRNLGPQQSCEALADSTSSPGLHFEFKRQLRKREFRTYGQLQVDPSVNAEGSAPVVSEVELSAAAIEDINRSLAAGEDFPIGLFLEFQGKPSVADGKKKMESVFSGSTGDELNELVLQVQPLE